MEVLAQPSRIARRIRQRGVAIRSNEVQRGAAKAYSPHCRLPGKLMEWKVQFGARFCQASLRFSIYMNLPRQRRERGEVVFSRLQRDPGKAIAASNGAGRALAQRTVAIVDADLRHGVKHESAYPAKPEQ